MEFQKINIRELPKSPVTLLCDEWALLTAGGAEGFNTMTVSWGAVGELWGKDAVFAFVRPQRYTHEFLDSSDFFSLSFLGPGRREVHAVCGAKSGREVDKVRETGITPVFADGTVYFAEAESVLVCKKMAVQRFDPAGFLDSGIAENYPMKDYHSIFIGEITAVYQRV